MSPYLVLLRVGFTMPQAVTSCAVRSYRTISPLPTEVGGLFSAALSVGFHPPGVTWHSVLWSPDFPPQTIRILSGAIAWPTPGRDFTLYRKVQLKAFTNKAEHEPLMQDQVDGINDQKNGLIYDCAAKNRNNIFCDSRA